jgi:hypothetical protein
VSKNWSRVTALWISKAAKEVIDQYVTKFCSAVIDIATWFQIVKIGIALALL